MRALSVMLLTNCGSDQLQTLTVMPFPFIFKEGSLGSIKEHQGLCVCVFTAYIERSFGCISSHAGYLLVVLDGEVQGRYVHTYVLMYLCVCVGVGVCGCGCGCVCVGVSVCGC